MTASLAGVMLSALADWSAIIVTPQQLIRDWEVRSRPFLRDFKSFLNQPEEVLWAIAELGDSPEGFLGDQQHNELNERFGIALDTASDILRVADYLYVRTGSLRMNAADAVAQVDAVASRVENPVFLDEGRRDAIVAILSFKSGYERTIATRNITASGPHFTGVGGSWGVKMAQVSNGETIRIPILSLNVTWHDGVGNHREVFLQLSDQEWESLNSQLQELDTDRNAINEILDL